MKMTAVRNLAAIAVALAGLSACGDDLATPTGAGSTATAATDTVPTPSTAAPAASTITTTTTVQVEETTIALDAPVGVRLWAQGNSGNNQFITIRWDIPDTPIISQIERDGEIVEFDDDNGFHRSERAFEQGQAIVYRIRFVDGNATSEWSAPFETIFDCDAERCPLTEAESAEMSATTTTVSAEAATVSLDAPVGVRLWAQGNSGNNQFITIRWDIPDTPIISQIERDGEIVEFDDDNDTFRDQAAFEQQQTIVYRIRFVDGNAASEWSAPFETIFDCDAERCPLTEAESAEMSATTTTVSADG